MALKSKRSKYLKYSILVLIALNILFLASAHAVQVEIRGRNSKELFFHNPIFQLPISVGAASESLFKSNSIPYQGSVAGFSKIFDLAQEVEVLSDTELKAYGWCFSVDGEVPETMTDKTFLINQKSILIWFYAYAHYKNGQWVAQCVPDHSNSKNEVPRQSDQH
jgi:hypothetical protein